MENSQQKHPQPANQNDINQKGQKPKQTRTRKTIDQELADLEAKKQRLLESKRKAETREKIIFGATVIAMLKDMKKRNDKNGETIAKIIHAFAASERMKELETIEKIIEQTTGAKMEVKS